MVSRDVPEPEYDFVERLLIRAGLLGFIAGLGVVYIVIFFICRRAIEFFFPGA